MRAVLRWKTILLAGGLWLVPASALAQETTQPATTNTPATDSIGPKELQGFSLPGTTTRPADQPAPAPSTNAPAARTENAPAIATAKRPTAARASAPYPAVQGTKAVAAQPPRPMESAPPPAVSTPLLAPIQQAVQTPPAPVATPSSTEPEHKLSLLPWIAAALALAGSTIFLLWRRRPREAFAGAEFDLFAAPEPEPVPQAPAPPRPVPQPKPAAPTPNGFVSSRLRPSLEITVQPVRCIVEEDQVAIEFELDLFNSGTAPARAVLAEASLFNVGPNQEQELSAFFARPVGAGNRIDAIPPLKRLTFTSRVVAPRSAIQEYALAGRKSFVPVIAFNALYEWSGGKGQTSAAYLVGRETSSDKLGPLRLDLGPRDVRGLGARTLPTALRV